MDHRIALVSCVKAKQPKAAPARLLYKSPLFRKTSSFAEQNADTWWILSAKHGLIDPNKVLDPYEETLNTMRKAEREEWAERVAHQMSIAGLLDRSRVILWLAGRRYIDPLRPFLAIHKHENPLEGLPIGERLKWLNARNA